MLTAPNRQLQSLFWLRGLALVGQLTTLCVVVAVLHIPMPLEPMLAVEAGLLVFNIYTAYRLRRSQQGHAVAEVELALQLIVDMLALAALLYCSGGAHNPFSSLFLVPIALAGLMLPVGYVCVLTVLALFLYINLMLNHWPLPEPNVEVFTGVSLHVLGMAVNFVISACLLTGFTVYLAAKWRDSQHALRDRRERKLRQEQILALGTLAAGTAHELGTPLATMAVVVADLEQDVSPDLQPDVQLLAQQIRSCKEILQQLVQQVATIEQSTHYLSIEDLLVRLLDRLQLLRPQATIALPVWPEGHKPQVQVDTTLEQGLLNLLNNAVDESPQAVSLACQWQQGRVILDILDRGTGFSAEVLALAGMTIVGSRDPDEHSGMGIGLLLANATIERFGGSVHFLPRVGGGAITRVELPCLLLS